MPTWNDVLAQIGQNPFDLYRRHYLAELHKKTGRNVIVYYSGWLQKEALARQGIRFEIHDGDKTGFMSTIQGLDCSKGLDLFLHTPGGGVGATESIVHYLRQKFGNNIRAIVPQLAMSAGTMIACACKPIVMGSHSNLGPIDPLYRGFAAHGVIEEFKQAKIEISQKKPGALQVWQGILSKYSPTLIGECEKGIKWTESVVADWLRTNMFAGDRQATRKVKAVIKELGSHTATLSHDRHIPREILRDKLKMDILDLEADQELQDKVLSVHHACIITLTQTAATKIIENHVGKAFVEQVRTQ